LKQAWSLALAALAISACGGNVPVFTLDVGTCFDDTEESQVSSVPEVDCAEPHDNEVFAVFDYTETDTFPGSEALNAAATDLCIAQFQDYVGVAYDDSRLEVLTIIPTEAGWENGDREVICSVYNRDLSKLTGSMRGSAG
jgi:hypothetical protein